MEVPRSFMNSFYLDSDEISSPTRLQHNKIPPGQNGLEKKSRLKRAILLSENLSTWIKTLVTIYGFDWVLQIGCELYVS